MSLHTINRMSEDKFGTGLPIYLKKEYQIRRPNLLGDSIAYDNSKYGYWICPSNKLPTLQFLYTGATLTTLELIEVCGSEDAGVTNLPITAVETQAINTGTVFYTTDIERKFNICSGLYYLKFTMSDAQEFFSEVFAVGSICALNNKLSYQVVQSFPDLSVDANLTLFASSENDVQSITLNVGGIDYFGNGTNLINFPNGDTTIKLTVVSEACGTYEQTYSFINDNAVSFDLVKQYS